MFFFFSTVRTPPRPRTVNGGYSVTALGDPRHALEMVISGPTRPQSRPGIRGAAFAFARIYSPSSRNQDAMREQMRTAFPGHVNPIYQDMAIEIDITFYMRRPLAHFVNGDRSNNLKANHSCDYTQHVSKPDLDNMAKFVVDALTGFAYADDKVVYKLSVCKIYDTVGYCLGRTKITVTPDIVDLTDI